MNAVSSYETRPTSLLKVVLITLACAGCAKSGPPQVTGHITINGVPVKQGEIRLAPADGGGAVVSGLITDGAYAVSATPGSNRVEIQAFEQTGVEPMDASMPGSATVPVMKALLPAKYNTASELTLEVTADVEKDFDLTAP